jgi:epidermal growth factor receptor substrate 15
MAPRVWNSIFLTVLCIISVLFSPASFAFSQKILDQILKQNPNTLILGLMTFSAVFVFLLFFVIIIKIQQILKLACCMSIWLVRSSLLIE